MYFQALDDKKNCIGIYYDGRLVFDDQQFPRNFEGFKTWKYSGSITEDVEYLWFYGLGKSLSELCPPHLESELNNKQQKMRAFKKAFEIAKIDFRQHCFFDLVPHDFLESFLETKNKITKHVHENYKKPIVYEHLVSVEKLLYKIRYQELKLDNGNLRHLFINTNSRIAAQKILKSSRYIDYNIFGTKTGRLTTHNGSFPILTMKKELRALVKPKNDWFISLDYNGAEVRTVLSLLGHKQPDYDVHEWNMENVLKRDGVVDRERAKTEFFGWLYNPKSTKIRNSIYDRDKVIEQYYDGEHVTTPFGRKIMVDKDKALNYLIQSTTADLVNERAVEIDKFLDGRRSFISHIVHDEVVIDLADEERHLMPEIKEIFTSCKLGDFVTNLRAGKNYYNLEDLKI